MTLKEFREKTKYIAGSAEIVFYEEGAAEGEDGEKLMPGIGLYDMEEHEFIYLGDISIIEDDSNNR